MNPPQKIYDILPNALKLNVKKLRKIKDSLTEELGRVPTLQEMHKELKLPEESIQTLEKMMLIVEDPGRHTEFESLRETVPGALTAYLLGIQDFLVWCRSRDQVKQIRDVLKTAGRENLENFLADHFRIITRAVSGCKLGCIKVTAKPAGSAMEDRCRARIVSECAAALASKEAQAEDVLRLLWLKHGNYDYSLIDSRHRWLLQEIDPDVRAREMWLTRPGEVNWSSLVEVVKDNLGTVFFDMLQKHLMAPSVSPYQYGVTAKEFDISEVRFRVRTSSLSRRLRSGIGGGILRNRLIDKGFLVGERYVETKVEAGDEPPVSLADLIAGLDDLDDPLEPDSSK